MRQRPATPRAFGRSNERSAGVEVSKRARLVGTSLLCAAALLVICIPRGWVAADDSTDARQRAAASAGRSNAPLSRAVAEQKPSRPGRALRAELSDPSAEDAAATSDSGAVQPTRVVPSDVGLIGDGPVEPVRSALGFGGNIFGFDLFAHIGQRGASRQPDGPYVAYHPEGGLAVEGSFENGERDGDWASYYTDGAVRLDGQYSDGKRVGRWKAYHPNGQLMGEGEFSGGLREGVWVLYYSNGLVKEQGVFEHDLRHGPWQYYDTFGQLEARSGFYRYGRLL